MMSWQQINKKLGLIDFESWEHFTHWRKNENDDEEFEKRIAKAYKDYYFT